MKTTDASPLLQWHHVVLEVLCTDVVARRGVLAHKEPRACATAVAAEGSAAAHRGGVFPHHLGEVAGRSRVAWGAAESSKKSL